METGNRTITRRQWMGGTAALLGSAVASACDPAQTGSVPARIPHAGDPPDLREPDLSLATGRGQGDNRSAARGEPLADAGCVGSRGQRAREVHRRPAAAEAPPDSYSANSTDVQTDFVDGLGLSLEPYLKTSKVIKKVDIWPSLRLDMEFRGVMTGLPYAPDTRILFTHVANAQAAGLDANKAPARWTDIREAAKRALRA